MPDDTLKCPERFVIVITGKVSEVLVRENVQAGIGHYLTHLMKGGELREWDLRSWGLRVAVEEDMDQGDDT